MGRRHTPVPAAHDPRGAGREKPEAVVHDGRWAKEARTAAGASVLLVALLVGVDAVAGGFGGVHLVVWVCLAALLFAVLVPRRTSAGEGWLSSRGLLGRRRVRTDRLVSVRLHDGVDGRLLLRDVDGGRVEVDPRVLLATPQLWYRLETDARISVESGTLRYGARTLLGVAARLDGETARSVFRLSGLE